MSEQVIVRVGLVRDEIARTSPKIIVDVDAVADPGVVPRAVSVVGVDGTTSRVGERRFIWASNAPLRPGRHTFLVGALTDTQGHVISSPLEIPFHVVETRAVISEALRMESFTRIRRSNTGFERLSTEALLDGRYIDFVKAAVRESGAPVRLAFDENGAEIPDADAILDQHLAGLTPFVGKLHRDLLARLVALDPEPDARLRIDAWFSVDEPPPKAEDRPEDPSGFTKQAQQAAQLTAIVRAKAAAIASEVQKLDVTIKQINPRDIVPVLTLDVPAKHVRDIAARADIEAVFLHEMRGIDDLQGSIRIAGSNLVHARGQRGEGVRVAVWEAAPLDTTNLVIQARFDPAPAVSNIHSQAVHYIISNKLNPDGHAPACRLHSANTRDRSALTWAIDEPECSVINQSFHRPGEGHSDTLSTEDWYKDWLALHWPHPLIVQAAGNTYLGEEDHILPPSAEYVNHKGYNSLSVGSHDDDARLIDPISTFRNPTSPHGDRELPEIAANGTIIETDTLPQMGTSCAAPAVAAVAALIQGEAPVLVHWPEVCRAILQATASPRINGTTWWQDVMAGVDAADGAGALNALEAYEVARSPSRRDSVAQERGWHMGLFEPLHVDAKGESIFSYNLSVPSSTFSAWKVRVALAWTSTVGKVGNNYSSQLTVDLDLRIYDKHGVQVGFSGSWDNSYEIAEFTGTPGAAYTIKLRRWSGKHPTWYGIAWTALAGVANAALPRAGDIAANQKP